MSMKYRWSKEVEAVELDSEWMILHAEQRTVTNLNEVGGLVWANLREPSSVEEIVDAVVQSHDVAREQALADIMAFLEELGQHGLVECL